MAEEAKPKVVNPRKAWNDKDSFAVNSIGSQIQSQKANAAHVGFSKCGRDKREKVFISKEASASQLSPDSLGPIYDLPSTLHIDKGSEGIRFGTGPKNMFGYRGKPGINFFPDNSLDGVYVDNVKGTSKYPRFTTAVIGTQPLGQMNNINLLKSNTVAFMGQDSPGPMYGLPSIDKMKSKLTYSLPFGIKGTFGSMFNSKGKTPPNVTPNTYPPMTSFGRQKLSQRRNPTTYRFNTQKKFGRATKKVEQAPIDVPLSAFHGQVKSEKRTEPKVGFSQGTRAQAQRISRCMHPLDAPMPKQKVHIAQPPLPAERSYINHSGSAAAIR